MTQATWYLLLADAILIVHVLFIAFVVLGFFAIYAGVWLSWSWVKNLRFRIIHLVAMMFVMLESWLGAVCPLTQWEMLLRQQSGANTYQGSFVQHWLQQIVYYDAPEWVFIAAYTLFAAMIVVSWFLVPPGRH